MKNDRPTLPAQRGHWLDMEYDEAIYWLHSRGGSLTILYSDDGGGQILASAGRMTVAVTVKDRSNPSEVRRCELESIRQLRQMLF